MIQPVPGSERLLRRPTHSPRNLSPFDLGDLGEPGDPGDPDQQGDPDESGDDLPRTGTSVTAALILAALLVTVGGGALYTARRRRRYEGCRGCGGELAQDRRVGWAIEHGEVTSGISTIAAPVYDVLPCPIAAIRLSLAEGALTEDTEPLVDKVLAAAEVTAKLR